MMPDFAADENAIGDTGYQYPPTQVGYGVFETAIVYP